MFINCVYCGHRYGPDDAVAATMQQLLYEHIAKCPKHPLQEAHAENKRLREALEDAAYELKITAKFLGSDDIGSSRGLEGTAQAIQNAAERALNALASDTEGAT